ncbi:MAG: hypothetical protein IKJ01_04760 [Lachnospiraceae bacterium]|nr:hypothetical protein [Lachnospiraceae bacterium]
MKLFFLKNISKTISFTGVLELEGEDLNKFFRDMETPAHDKWKPESHSNPELAKEYFQELKKWVTDKVNELGEQDYSDERDIVGLGSILNVNVDHENSKEKREGLNNLLGEIEKIEVEAISKTQGYYIPGSENEIPNKNKEQEKVQGTISEDGSTDAIRILKGTRKRKKTEQHRGFFEEEGKDIITKTIGKGSPYPLMNLRVMRLSDGKYRITYTLPRDLSSGHIEIVTVGENGKKVKLNVIEVHSIKNSGDLFVSNGEIKFKEMKGKEKVQLEFKLPELRNYAMEVKIYEHKQ